MLYAADACECVVGLFRGFAGGEVVPLSGKA